MSTPAERIAVLDAITAALGASVTKRSDDGYGWTHWQNVSVPYPGDPGVDIVAVSLHYHDDRKGDYVHVSGDWPKDYQGIMVTGRDAQWGASNPSINVSAAKRPEVAAADIRRRFLPEYVPLYAKAMGVVMDRAAYDSAVADNWAALAAALGTKPARMSHNGAWTIRGQPEGVRITHVNDTSVRLELDCTPGMACEILRQRAMVAA
jgi:hypothetical protein